MTGRSWRERCSSPRKRLNSDSILGRQGSGEGLDKTGGIVNMFKQYSNWFFSLSYGAAYSGVSRRLQYTSLDIRAVMNYHELNCIVINHHEF